MRREFFTGTLIALGMLLLVAQAATAQEVTAEVRTWTGRAWRLSEPWIRGLLHDHAQAQRGGDAAHGGTDGRTAGHRRGGGAHSRRSEVRFSGPETLRLWPRAEACSAGCGFPDSARAGVEVAGAGQADREPDDRPAPSRTARSRRTSLRTHFRYSAVATLADGSRVEADYFNFGTAVVRGMTTAGRVEIQFDEIETLRFEQ